MLVAVMGASGVGKTRIIRSLLATGSFKPLRSYTTRPERPGEALKVHLDHEMFARSSRGGWLTCCNTFFNESYGLSTLEVSIATADPSQVFVIDFALSRWDQLSGRGQVLGIVLLPESREQLEQQLIHAGRGARLEEALREYDRNYAGFSEGALENGLHAVRNIRSQIQRAADQICDIVETTTGRQIMGIMPKRERLLRALQMLKAQPRLQSGLATYARLSALLNQVDDELVGAAEWYPPVSFDRHGPSVRLYPIAPESYRNVEQYPGVSAWLTRREVLYISRYGAIEVHAREEQDALSVRSLSADLTRECLFEMPDASGDGLWHPKNAAP